MLMRPQRFRRWVFVIHYDEDKLGESTLFSSRDRYDIDVTQFWEALVGVRSVALT